MRPILLRLFPFLAAAVLLAGVVPAGARAANAAPYWVFFTDRGALNAGKILAAKRTSAAEPKNRSRRARVLPPERLFDESDLPVYPTYIEAVAGYAVRIRTVTRFLNGVSAELDGTGLSAVRALPFVREVRPVAGMVVPPEPRTEEPAPPKSGKTAARDYGQSLDQLTIADIIRVHDAGYMGSGILIAVLDDGFDNLSHSAFDSLDVREVWDFVDADGNVAGDDHGTSVLSVIAGLDEGSLIGAAPYASFLLARTEIYEGEDIRAEEDYWVAAVEWADSIGVDVISSSLGYTTFQGGEGYTPADLDGDTAVTTVAADIAASKGIVVVVSAGNEALDPTWHFVTTPADGDSVIAVGAVNRNEFVLSFSSRGPTADGRVKPDVMALGQNVWVADAAGSSSYHFDNGTSFAAPAVSGAAALILEANPTWTGMDVVKSLRETARDAGPAGPDSLYGYGIVSAYDAAGIENNGPAAGDFRVYDPFPQPIVFGTENTRIYFPVSIPVAGLTITIRIFTFTGEVVNILEIPAEGSGELRLPSGETPSWDGTNFLGDPVAPGVYYYTIRLFGYGAHTGKLVVMQ